jgi:hypothetical protein
LSHTIGHNSGEFESVTLAASVEKIEKYLDNDTFAIRQKARLIAVMLKDFLRDYAAITTDVQQAMATDVAGQTKLHLKLIEERREAIKRPWIDGGRAIQTYFSTITSPVDELLQRLEKIQTAYAKEIETQRRKAALDAALAAQAVADEAADIAAESLSSSDLDAANHAAEHADALIALANDKPATHSRTVGDYETVSSLRTVLVIELEDISKVPPEYLLLNEKKARSDVLAAKRRIETLTIPGVEIRWDPKIQNYTKG